MTTKTTIKRKHAGLRLVGLVWVMVLFLNPSFGQYAKFYSQYVGPAPANTGGLAGTAGAGGTLGGPGAVGTHSVINPNFINDADYTNFVQVNAQSGTPGTGVLPGPGGASSSYVQLNFSGSVNPGSSNPVIIKLVASSNSGGLLGSLFTSPLAQVTIQAYNLGSPVGSSVNVSNLTVTSTNEYLFTPTATCNAIRISVTTDPGSGGLIGGAAATASANIYYAYVFDPNCSPPNYTTTSITGLLSLGGTFTNLGGAVDNNITTYSSLVAGIGVGATLHQNVYFPTLSGSGDVVTAAISIPPSVLSVGALSSYSVTAYNGSTSVGSISFNSLLGGTDLLTLLQAGGVASFSYAPTAPFDRVEITMGSLLAVATTLNIYEISRTQAKPSFTLPLNDTVDVCFNSSTTLNANPPAAGYQLRWYSSAAASNTTILSTGSYTTPTLTANAVYYVAVGKIGCLAESERVPVRVMIKPLPTITLTTPVYACIGTTTVNLAYTAVTNSPITYSVVWSGAASGFNPLTNETLPASLIGVLIPTNTAAGSYPGTLTVRNNTSGTQCTSVNNNFSIIVQNNPNPTPVLTSYQ